MQDQSAMAAILKQMLDRHTGGYCMKKSKLAAVAIAAVGLCASLAFGHGNVTPQPIDVAGLKPVGTEWLKENPYRNDTTQKELATTIGASGYNQNCARCHGLEVISGGIAPDLRYLEEGKLGDEWFLERIRGGYTQNGMTKMPKFEGIFSQEAMWAIRTYIESRPHE
jgi:cytochrome c-550 PedF